MPNYTTNYKLTKPLDTDLYDIGVQNNNMDIVDEALGVRHMKTYTKIEQLGLTIGQETLLDIATSLPAESILITATGQTNAAIYPYGTYGLLVVSKYANNRVLFRWTHKDTCADFTGFMSDGAWSGWMRSAVSFSDLSQIGVENSTATIEEIVDALPNNSSISYAVSGNETGIYPTNYGLVTINKISSSRVEFRFISSTGDMFFTLYNSTATTPWTGWKSLYNDADIIPVANGGTGASTKSDARKNLGLEIQCGVENDIGTSGKTITFPKEFSGIPVVTASGGSEAGSVYVRNITTTSFLLVSGVGNNDGVQWQAIYTS